MWLCARSCKRGLRASDFRGRNDQLEKERATDFSGLQEGRNGQLEEERANEYSRGVLRGKVRPFREGKSDGLNINGRNDPVTEDGGL